MKNNPANLDALYNFYRYASGGVVPKTAKAAGKKKTVPTAIDWGPNVPMDYLAYLNKQEMDLIQNHRAFKGKRDYNGIPAFPDPGDTAAGDKGQGTTSSSGLGGGNKTGGGGNTSGVGGGGGGGGGASGSRGSSTGSVGPSSGSQAPGNVGTGGQRGAGSNTGLGSARPGGPTEGGGFKAPGGSDIRDQQRAQTSDAIRTLNNTPSVRNDLSIGGIRSLNVGPMGAPVNVGTPIVSSATVPQGVFGPRVGVSMPDYLQSAAQPGIITTGMPSPYSGTVPQERILEIEDVPMPNETIVNKTNIPTFEAPRSPMKTRGLTAPSSVPTNRSSLATLNGNGPFSKVSGIGDIYDPNASFSEATKIPNWSQSLSPSSPMSPSSDADTYPGKDGITENDIVSDYSPSQAPGVPAPREDPVMGPGYPEDSIIEKGIKKAGLFGRAYSLADWAYKKNFGNMSLAEQRAEMARWNDLQNATRRTATSANDRGPYQRIPPVRVSESTVGTRAANEDTGRPSQYYRWDLGIGIPSPTDSDYTLYLKYLQEKAAQDAGA